MNREKDNFLIQANTVLNELLFVTTARLCDNDIDLIYTKLIDSGLDANSDGFWVLDIENEKEYYSPGFRASLGFCDEDDFPNVPESWQKQILQEDLDRAVDCYNAHVESLGKVKYKIFVTYKKKHYGTKKVLCHGKVVAWDGTSPKIMIGVHLNHVGNYKY